MRCQITNMSLMECYAQLQLAVDGNPEWQLMRNTNTIELEASTKCLLCTTAASGQKHADTVNLAAYSYYWALAMQLIASEKRSSKTGGSHCPCCCGARSTDRLMASRTNLFCCYSWSWGTGWSWVASLQLDHRQQVQPRWGSDRKASSPLKTFLAAGLVTCLYKEELCSAASVPVLVSTQNQDAGLPFLAASLAASTFQPEVDENKFSKAVTWTYNQPNYEQKSFASLTAALQTIQSSK